MAAELAEEKKSIEKAAMELRQEKDTTEQWVEVLLYSVCSFTFFLYPQLTLFVSPSILWSRELKGTLSAMQQIEEEKSKLFKQTESLQANLEVSKHFKNTFSYLSLSLSLSLSP